MRIRCLIVVLTLVVAPLSWAVSPDHAWSRGDGEVIPVENVALAGMEATFGLGSDHLGMCAVRDGLRYELDLTGEDVMSTPVGDLQSLMGQASFQLNRDLAKSPPGVDLVNEPGRVAVGLRMGTPETAKAVVSDDLRSLEMALFADAGGCRAPAGPRAASAPLFIADAVEADECSGACNCDICVCEGSETCCAGGCGYCWGVLDGSGAC